MNFQDVISRLKSNKCRITPQRKIILEVLFSHQNILMTIDEICDLCQKTNQEINTTTVYRNIELLDSLGLVYSMNVHRHTLAYKLICHDHHHHHLICTTCGKMTSIDYCPINAELLSLVKNQGYILEDHSLKLFGRCATCQELDSNEV